MREFDEAFDDDGEPRPHYAAVLQALGRQDLARLRDRARRGAAERGLEVGRGRPLAVDPVPRVFSAAEWAAVREGAIQRARALNAFIADAYGEGLIFQAGVAPRRLLDSPSYEPRMRGLIDPSVPPAALYGLDLVRAPDGSPLVLEDNLRMPSGCAYAIAIRELVGPALGADVEPAAIAGFASTLGEALRAAAPEGCGGDPSVAILSDGPESATSFEHLALGRRLGIPIVTPGGLEPDGDRLIARIEGEPRRVDVLYRRLDEERLTREDGSATRLGELLLPALEAGRLRCVNAFGSGVADDKLTHAYVEAMIRFYLREEPLLRSVPSFDLGDEETGSAALERVEELVVKPRDGFGGRGVTIMPVADESERADAAMRVRRRPDRFVAQELVPLSRHPTVCDGGLSPRRVDLRPFVVSAPGGAGAMPGGLTRFARGADEMIVNSSRGGGCKDTWVIGP